ncbi:MAG: hypothetical protein GYB66_07730 [Chloroflexi bacterium]|nr:hypothetical protein [Chloroflexota bacterium]
MPENPTPDNHQDPERQQAEARLVRASNALEDLARYVYDVTVEAAARTMGNLRIEAIRHEQTLTERFLAYMEMGLDRQIVEAAEPLRISAIAFTDRGKPEETLEQETGADLACFVRYDLPGLRWAKGFLGQSKLATVTSVDDDGRPHIGLQSEADYDEMIENAVAMRKITEESYVFFFSPESVTVEKTGALIGDMEAKRPQRPWQDIHHFRQDQRGVNIAQFYGAFVACQLGDILLDRPAAGYSSMLDLITARGIGVILLVMVGAVPPLPQLTRDSSELAAMPFEVPETYWAWPQLLHSLMNQR